MKFLGLFSVVRLPVTISLLVAILLNLVGVALLQLILLYPKTTEAAMVTVEANPNTTAAVHTQSGASTVFISDQVGYKFHRYGAAPSNGACVYRKTLDGGVTWGAFVVVDSQTDCSGISVWYDQWTPGDTGSYIHIATIDTGNDDVFYNRLDTNSDTLLLATATSTSLGLATTYTIGTNENSITKATDGRLFVVGDDGNGTVLRSCVSNCNISTNWTTPGTAPQGNADSWSMLLPLSAGNIILINRSTANTIRSSVWNGTSWSAFTTIDAAAVRNTTYDVGMAATLDTVTGDIYLAYVADNDTFTVADHDIRTAIYSAGSRSSKTNIFTNVAARGLLQVAISRNQNNGDIYVGYTARATIGTANTASAYYVSSSNGMTSWGAQQGPLNTTPGDLYGIDMNLMAYERIYASWFNVTAGDVFGDTVADIGPETELSAIATQTAQVRTSTNNFYVGGSFVLETLSSRTVSSVVISETGTIHAQTNIKNVKLYYDLDTSVPYNCASESYGGSETQFGSTVVGGFSGADGVAAFTASPISISPTQSMCLYTVLDVQATAVDGNTIEVSVADPSLDVIVSGGIDVYPDTAIALASTTTIVDPDLTQSGYHWRLDNGTEVTASSATAGVENTPLSALQIGTPRRLRVAVANQGSTTTLPSTYRLEYGAAAPTCEDVGIWTVVGDTGADWLVSNSVNLTDGANTTNISVGSGGVTDLGSTFVASNGAVRDTATNTASLTLAINNFFEAEFSIVASSSAVEGSTYCFRMTGAGNPLSVYTHYPSVTIAADVLVQSFGSQIATVDVSDTSMYSGGGFSIAENSSSRLVTSVTLSEQGTVDGDTGLANLALFYESDTTAPYNCSSETYAGTENQFGSTLATGFSSPGETAVFTDSVAINTTSALCLYAVYDVTTAALNAQTIEIAITTPATDVVVSAGGSVGPSSPALITGETLIQGGILTQSHYHWRNNNGSEATATSQTGGVEDTPITDFAQSTPIRLRLGVTNTGLVASAPARLRVEYAPKITTCDMATVWTDVDSAADGWDMYDSTFLTNGETTTNISVGSGGVSDGVGSFIGSNGAVRDTESMTGTTTVTVNDFLDLEFSLTSTSFTSFDTTYCFRVSAAGTAFGAYTNYAEITTAPKRDFKIQRGFVQVSGTSSTVVAGVGYTAPASSSKAFVRITNSQYTGAGNSAATAGQNADDVTAYISNPQNLLTNFTIARPAAATSNTRVDWEIIEFVGNTGTDNEIIVHDARTINLSTVATVATGTTVASVSDDSQVVVFITGIQNLNISRNFYAGQVTSEWNAAGNLPVFRRGNNGASSVNVSYAVVEFVGINWNVQRAQHSYTAAGVTETESITAVNSLARTFIHAQKRMGATTNVVHYGHEVWLSSIGAVSFQLETGASVAIEQTSVAWIIENTQTSVGAMAVQRSNGITSAGTAPLSLSITIPTPLDALNNTSIMGNTRSDGANTTYPRPNAGLTITSTTTYQIWRSNTGSTLTYRVELVEWPVADLSIKQNYYRFYADNNSLTPTDPWPLGIADLGENTSITVADEPLGSGDTVRVRMTMRTANATMPAGFVNFKLQYALRASTCSAIDVGDWFDVGAIDSSAVWRGYAGTGTTDGTALSTNPPTGGDLLISLADRAGVLVHDNPTAVNPYPVDDGDNIEYDWQLQHNGAIPQSTYCFRTVRSDGTPLEGYSNYPQIRTASFSPVTKNWRWYGDINNETPTAALAVENIAPIDIANSDTIALRISVRERRNVVGENVKFKLQFSEDATFANSLDVVATSSCQDQSLWCYAEGAAIDNQLISTQVLSDGDGCTAGAGNGCGRHNTSAVPAAGHVHFANKVQEYSFTIKHMAARVNAVYYFRLYDVTNGTAVAFDTSEAFPSLVTEGPTLQLSVAGLAAGTTTAGVVTDITTSPSGISFGAMSFNTEYIGAHRLSILTNATEGYQVLKFARQQLTGPSGRTIAPVAGTNASPQSWATSCLASSTGCVGYHTTDATLRDGSTRFAPTDTYAGLVTSPVEVMYSSIPSADTHDIVYRIRVNELQPAGDYETEIVYLAIPAY
jgi:hypothetical protein